LRSDLLRCAACGVALTLDHSQTGTPDEVAITHDWDSALVKLAGAPSVSSISDESETPMAPAGPSAESLREVRRQSRLRQIKRFFNR